MISGERRLCDERFLGRSAGRTYCCGTTPASQPEPVRGSLHALGSRPRLDLRVELLEPEELSAVQSMSSQLSDGFGSPLFPLSTSVLVDPWQMIAPVGSGDAGRIMEVADRR